MQYIHTMDSHIPKHKQTPTPPTLLTNIYKRNQQNKIRKKRKNRKPLIKNLKIGKNESTDSIESVKPIHILPQKQKHINSKKEPQL